MSNVPPTIDADHAVRCAQQVALEACDALKALFETVSKKSTPLGPGALRPLTFDKWTDGRPQAAAFYWTSHTTDLMAHAQEVWMGRALAFIVDTPFVPPDVSAKQFGLFLNADIAAVGLQIIRTKMQADAHDEAVKKWNKSPSQTAAETSAGEEIRRIQKAWTDGSIALSAEDWTLIAQQTSDAATRNAARSLRGLKEVLLGRPSVLVLDGGSLPLQEASLEHAGSPPASQVEPARPLGRAGGPR